MWICVDVRTLHHAYGDRHDQDGTHGDRLRQPRETELHMPLAPPRSNASVHPLLPWSRVLTGLMPCCGAHANAAQWTFPENDRWQGVNGAPPAVVYVLD